MFVTFFEVSIFSGIIIVVINGRVETEFCVETLMVLSKVAVKKRKLFNIKDCSEKYFANKFLLVTGMFIVVLKAVGLYVNGFDSGS